MYADRRERGCQRRFPTPLRKCGRAHRADQLQSWIGARGTFPRFLPVTAEHLQNWAFRFGIVVPRTPVIAIAASPTCRLDSIDWSALRVWPAQLPRANGR
jgi:hypothetical protein